QFFGEVNIDRHSHALTVDFRDIDGTSIFSKTLQPVRGPFGEGFFHDRDMDRFEG
ncbi:hypothetical protein H4F85_28715, partial [Citrobacter braakii]|nr:hypothetical protein [Citrobacter braakii]